MDPLEAQASTEIELAVNGGSLVQQRFPVSGHSSHRPRYGLIFGMRMRRKQPHTLDHRLLFVVVEPILTRLKAGNDRMARHHGMLGCMLAGRTVAASDMPALRAPAEMKPPTIRRSQAFHTPIAYRLRSGVDSALNSFHFDLSSLLTRYLPTPNSLASGLRTQHRAFLPHPLCSKFSQAAAQLCNWTMVLAMLRFCRHTG